ncbi:unnamed protein product [Boreogadus saida]
MKSKGKDTQATLSPAGVTTGLQCGSLDAADVDEGIERGINFRTSLSQRHRSGPSRRLPPSGDLKREGGKRLGGAKGE